MLDLLEIQEVPSHEEINPDPKIFERLKRDLREIEILERRIVPTGSGETVLPL